MLFTTLVFGETSHKMSQKFKNNRISVQGTYEISGNQIRFIDDDCGTFEGFYTYSINENTLSFVYISDSCTERALTLLLRDHEKH